MSAPFEMYLFLNICTCVYVSYSENESTPKEVEVVGV